MRAKLIKQHCELATVGIFDWTLFDNSNWTKVVRRPSKGGMFNSDLVRLIPPKNLNKKSQTKH